MFTAFTFTSLRKFIGQSYNGRGLRSTIGALGLECPADSTGMYLRGESPEYILAAALACTQGAGA